MLFSSSSDLYPFSRMQPTPHYVQHPASKRPMDMRDEDGAPRAKRRFERVNARFEDFHISDDAAKKNQIIESSSDDEEMTDFPSVSHEQKCSTSHSWVTVEEPEEDETSKKKLRLSNELTSYLEKTKDKSDPFWERMSGSGKVNEGALTLWIPPSSLPNPFDDPSMKGRIYEVEEEEKDPEILPDEDFDTRDSSLSPEVSYPDEHFRRIASSDSIDSSASSLQQDSPPDYHRRIIEVLEGGTSTDDSQDDSMEID